MNVELYQKIRSNLRTGDLVAFSGINISSVIVKAATDSTISHLGTIIQTTTASAITSPLQIIESTSLDNLSGVSLSRLSLRIAQYVGTVWILPLSPRIRKRFNEPAFVDFLLSQKGKPYDLPGAIKAGLADWLPALSVDFSSLFCSELLCAAYQKAGIANVKLNPSEATPKDIIQLPIYKEAHHVSGKFQIIH